jgi:Tat protein secretion system quality control protein TatD with DNase activity
MIDICNLFGFSDVRVFGYYLFKERCIDENTGEYLFDENNDIGYDLASSKLAAEHAAKYPWCHAAVGIHPHDAKNADDLTLSMIRMLAAKPGVVAIGEIGLDFHYDHSPRDDQRLAFRRQIRMAIDLKMPIVIHSREADLETMEILKEEGAFSEERKADFPARPVPHDQTASADHHKTFGPWFVQLNNRYNPMD